MIDITKPPVSTDPPILPPFLRGKPRRRRNTIILPDVRMLHLQTLIISPEHNWRTIVYQWMNRITGESLSDPDAIWETAHVQSRQYRQWLEIYMDDSSKLPHINFGGVLESKYSQDPTPYLSWIKWAEATFY